MYVDHFGYIPERLDLLWQHGQVRALEQFHDAVAWFKQYVHPKEHYLYPPLVHSRKGSHNGSSEKIEGTDRPALLHRLPATHELHVFDVTLDREVARYADGGFIIHFIGFLFGRRCQFSDWWVDGRVPAKAQTDFGVHGYGLASRCLEQALTAWRMWPSKARTVLINAMFLHNRAPLYEWDWERFQAEYQVLDALYAVAECVHRVKAKGHQDRIRALCDHFGLHRNDSLTKDMVELRNDLIHEALWGKQMPGTAPEGTFHMPIWLHRLNSRLGLALLGFQTDYVGSNWQSLGQFRFTLP